MTPITLRFRFLLTAAAGFVFLGLRTGASADDLITWEKLHLSADFYSEGACFGDIDKDGKTDVISGPFVWLGPDFKKNVAIYEPAPFAPKVYSDNFFSFTDDINGDGWLDVLVIGFPGKEAFWFANPQGKKGFWKKHLALAVVDNEAAGFTDLTGDGKPEIVCSQEGFFGFAEPDRNAPEKPWTFRRISSEKVAGGRFTHGLGVGDVNGDGRPDLLEKNIWWEHPEGIEGDPVWNAHRYDFATRGGAQMFAYDFDGDGDNDLVTSLNGHGYGLAWFEQLVRDGNKTFEKHLIMGDQTWQSPHGVVFSQLHGVALEDVDGDGVKDIITGKRYWAHGGKDPGGGDAAVLYWFQTVRSDGGGVSFVPHQIDNDSGVGTEVDAGDVNGDGLLDIVVGNKKGTFIHLQKRRVANAAAVEAARPARRFLDGIIPQEEYASGRPAAEAAAAMTLPEGFTATTLAAEPDLTQPITFCFDERGRIWVAEARTYPVRAPDGEGVDRILIFEDADHDGSFETRKVFASGLNIVSGLEVGFGGVWVGAAPYLMFIPDRDRDDVPDAEPEILLDGWAYQDTHETLNSFRWGPDGWLYGCHGVFNHSNVGKPGAADAERTFLNCAVWRYQPVRHEFEVFAHGTSNPWGIDFDERGQIFMTACVIPHLWHMIQGGYYERQGRRPHENPHLYALLGTIAKHRHYAGESPAGHAHWGPLRDAKSDIIPLDTFAAGGGHAHCGLTIYRGDNFPDEYRGELLFHNLHGHRINRNYVARSGSGFTGDRRPDFMFANDHWFVGTAVHYGPDGALYCADWHDDTTCHRREPVEWDRSNGRLYRIHHGEHRPVAVDLSKASNEELFAYHTHENEWYARMARRVLHERAAKGEVSADEFMEGLLPVMTKHPDEGVRLRALWTMHAAGGLMIDEMAAGIIENPSEYFRAWLIQIIGEDRQVGDEAHETLVGLAESDPSKVVRLYLASLLQRLPPEQAWPIAEKLARHGEDADDRNLPNMIWYGTEPLVAADPERAYRLARTTEIPRLRKFIYRRAAAVPGGYEAALQEVLAANDPETAGVVIAALAAQLAGEASFDMPGAWPGVYESLRGAAEADAQLKQNLLALAGKFRDRRLLPEFRALLADRGQTVELRLAALETLAMAEDAETVSVLHALVSGPASPLRGKAIASIASLRDAESTRILISAWPRFNQAEKNEAIAVLTARKGDALALLEAIGAGKIPRTDLSVVAARQILQFKDTELKAGMAEHWGVVNPTSVDKAVAIARYRKLFTPAYLAKANLGNGRQIFNQTCFACHQLFGEGINLAPDLTGANRSDLNYLLENVINPNALVGKDYQLTVFNLRGGQIVSGIVRGESGSAYSVVLPGGIESTVAKDEVTGRELLTLSLMPEGVLQNLSDADARDLIVYLQSPKQVRISNAGEKFIEGEALRVVSKTRGNPRPQSMAHFKLDSWSGDTHLWWTGGKPGDQLVLEFDVAEAGVYGLKTALTKAHDYGQVRLKLDGKTELIEHIDLYWTRGQVVTTGELNLGEHRLSAGPHRIVVDILGANPKAAKGFMFGIDYLSLLKKG